MQEGGYLIQRKVTILEFRRGLALARPDHKVHTEWQWPISGVHSIMMEKPAHAGEGEGVHALPLSLYLPSRTKLQCAFQLRGQIHSPYFISTLYVLCGPDYGPEWA